MQRHPSPAPAWSTEQWLTHVDAEVEAVCQERGWGRQIRRSWAVRDQPVWESGIEDHEWKLRPGSSGLLASGAPSADTDQGCYYVLRVDLRTGAFLLQHDTQHAGRMGLHRLQDTFTRFRCRPFLPADLPHAGSLRDHLRVLVQRFRPNTFSLT